jgi:hypothetical protein
VERFGLEATIVVMGAMLFHAERRATDQSHAIERGS